MTLGDLFAAPLSQPEAAAVWLPHVKELDESFPDGIPLAVIASVCPSCAKRMEKRGFSGLRLMGLVTVEKDMPGDMPKASADALCDKWGGDDGGFSFTDCDNSKIRDAMENPEGFCAALHKYCTGLWPTEKPKSPTRAAVLKYITHEGSKWIVHAESGKVLGTHDSEADAKAQLAAVEANKNRSGKAVDLRRRGALVLEKVGRVLSATNEATLRDGEQALQQALDALRKVLAQVEQEIDDAIGEDGQGSVSAYHAGEGVILPPVTAAAPPAEEKLVTPFGEVSAAEFGETMRRAMKEVSDRQRMMSTGRLPD